MILEMPKIPTAEEVRKMTDSEFSDVCERFFNYSWELVGALGTLRCDLFKIRYKSPEISDYINKIISFYEREHDSVQAVTDWLLKVRHFGHEEEFQK